jgi:hypothetical protein
MGLLLRLCIKKIHEIKIILSHYLKKYKFASKF